MASWRCGVILRRLPGKTDELKAKNLGLMLQSTRQRKGDSSLYSVVLSRSFTPNNGIAGKQLDPFV